MGRRKLVTAEFLRDSPGLCNRFGKRGIGDIGPGKADLFPVDPFSQVGDEIPRIEPGQGFGGDPAPRELPRRFGTDRNDSGSLFEQRGKDLCRQCAGKEDAVELPAFRSLNKSGNNLLFNGTANC